MALASLEYLKMVFTLDTDFVAFVAKLQKAKTRKDKDYFVLRTTVPKDIAEKIEAEAGDFIFFKAKKAQWYHMLDWGKMENTWKMLPDEIRNRIVVDGVYSQMVPCQTAPTLGATNLSAPIQQMIDMQKGDVSGNSL